MSEFNWSSELKSCWNWLPLFSPTHLCFLAWARRVNLSPQTLQAKVFSVWTVKCRLRSPVCANVLPQTEQLNGFSPVWTLMCLDKTLLSLKVFLQTEQVNGFSPVWILKCLGKLDSAANLLPQTEQLKGFSPVWILMCVTRFPLHWNDFLQTEQLKHFSSEWVLAWPCWSPSWPLLVPDPGFKFLTGSGPPQSSPSAPFCLWWSCDDRQPAHWWFLSWECQMNLFPQTLQLYRVSPVWSAMWRVRWIFWLNLLLHTEQLNGFSPVWVIMCFFSCELKLNFLSHSEQLIDFSPVLRPLFFRQCEPDGGPPLVLKSSLVKESGSEESDILSWVNGSKRPSGLKFQAGSGPPQSSTSASVRPWGSCEDGGFSSSSSSLFTVKLMMSASSSPWSCSPSWWVQSSSCSSLMWGGSGGSSWSRLELQSCCSGGSSSLLTASCWTSAENKEIQTRVFRKQFPKCSFFRPNVQSKHLNSRWFTGYSKGFLSKAKVIFHEIIPE